ncbi:hypothetical protein VNO77_33620 [Canavalia gladiata]|uniref:Uncharacterized protein n=1 Tax=Canavalia gladiata TaxID=3824 RepID=A0AAN9KF18_CANGL
MLEFEMATPFLDEIRIQPRPIISRLIHHTVSSWEEGYDSREPEVCRIEASGLILANSLKVSILQIKISLFPSQKFPSPPPRIAKISQEFSLISPENPKSSKEKPPKLIPLTHVF